MFYISKLSPFFFLLALLNLSLSLILKISSPDTFSFFYTLVFGFIGNTLLGAMYQIVPNSQNRKLSFPSLPYVVFSGSLFSSFLFLLNLSSVGSALLFVSYAIFSPHMLMNIKNWMPVTVRFLGASIFYLFLSSFFLLLHFWTGFVPFQVSIHSLTVGSMLNAIYGVEIAWIPMLLMETLNIKKAKRLFYMKQGSTALLLLSFLLMNYKLIAFFYTFEVGVGLYYIYLIYSIIKNRKMPSPLPYVVRVFILALIFLPLGLVIGGLMSSHPQTLPDLLRLHLDLLIYGFASLTIFGGIAHLLPRIVWNWKFKEKKVTVNELIDEKNFPRFIEVFFLAFALFLVFDVLYYPLNLLSPIAYAFIILYFFKMTFLHTFKKLKEVRDGSNN